MQYRIQFSAQAAKELRQISSEMQGRLSKRMVLLVNEPRPSGVKALQGQKGILRLRVGDYRILYNVDDENHLVRIIKIAYRRDVYRDL